MRLCRATRRPCSSTHPVASYNLSTPLRPHPSPCAARPKAHRPSLQAWPLHSAAGALSPTLILGRGAPEQQPRLPKLCRPPQRAPPAEAFLPCRCSGFGGCLIHKRSGRCIRMLPTASPSTAVCNQLGVLNPTGLVCWRHVSGLEWGGCRGHGEAQLQGAGCRAGLESAWCVLTAPWTDWALPSLLPCSCGLQSAPLKETCAYDPIKILHRVKTAHTCASTPAAAELPGRGGAHRQQGGRGAPDRPFHARPSPRGSKAKNSSTMAVADEPKIEVGSAAWRPGREVPRGRSRKLLD
jgi:hypothetical protein